MTCSRGLSRADDEAAARQSDFHPSEHAGRRRHYRHQPPLQYRREDGTVIGMVNRNMPHVALTKMANVQFDPVRFNWLGSPEISHSVCAALTGVPVQKAEDLFKHDLLIGGAGSGSAPSITAQSVVESARDEAQAGRGLQERSGRVACDDAQGGARRLPVAQCLAGRGSAGMDRGRQAQGSVQPRAKTARRVCKASATSSNSPRPKSSAPS